MAGFTYFVPTSAQPNLELIRSWGLGYAFSVEPMCREAQGATPAGRNGYSFHDPKRHGGQPPKIELDKQVWRKIPGRDDQQEVWLGYWRDNPPTPADLARDEQISGVMLKLGDGREWRLPLVRFFDETTEQSQPALDWEFDLDDNGNLKIGEVVGAQRWLWEITEPVWQSFTSESSLSQADAAPILARIIGANYAVSLPEMIALHTLNRTVTPIGLLALIVDYPTWAGWNESKKKTSSASIAEPSSTKLGETDDSHAIDQPALTS